MIIFIMFLLDTAMCILDVHNAISEITLTLTSTAPLSLADRYALTETIPYAVTNSLFAYMVCATPWLSQCCSFLIDHQCARRFASGTLSLSGEHTPFGAMEKNA